VEVSCQMLGVHDVAELGTKQTSKLLRSHALAGAFLAAQNDGYFSLPIGMLYGISHPVYEVFDVFRVATADVVTHVPEISVTIASASLATEAPPKVKSTIIRRVGGINDCLVLTAATVLDPPLADANFPTAGTNLE